MGTLLEEDELGANREEDVFEMSDLVLQPNNDMAEKSSCCRSVCCKGYILDKRCPLHLGMGLGPKVFCTLYESWEKCNQNSTFTTVQMDLAKKLETTLKAGALTEKTSNTGREQILSGRVSVILNSFLQTMQECAKFQVLHQIAVCDSGPEAADIGSVDATTLNCEVHNLLEMKNTLDANEFPEIQATAYAQLCGKENVAGSKKWMPVFALSRNHFRIGVAFDRLVEPQWAYSEIFSKVFVAQTTTQNEADVLALARFMTFFGKSAAFHLTHPFDPHDFDGFCDKNKSLIPVHTPWTVIAERVVMGTGTDGKVKVMKFYDNKAEAEVAITRNKMVATCLGYDHRQQLYEGLGPYPTCVVVDNFFEQTTYVSYSHLGKLTEQVFVVFESGLVLGDLRLQNVLFLKNGNIRMIDNDWAGKKREAEFPADVNESAFGEKAGELVSGSALIPADFDWMCLADILKAAGCPDAASAAIAKDKNRVLALLAKKKDEETNLQTVFRSSGLLNLFALRGRVGNYYRSTAKGSRKRKSADSGT